MTKNIHDSKITDHICMPVLFIFVLLMLRLSKREGRLIIYYDILPRYLRGVVRLFNISPTKLVSVLSIITGLTIQKIKHGDDVPDYPHLHLKAMETVTEICEQLITEMKLSPDILCLEKLIDNKPAKAYTAKYLSQYQLFPYVLPIVACSGSILSAEDYFVVLNPAWPVNWHLVIQQNLKQIKFETFKWPGWYIYMQRSLAKIALFLAIPIITLRYIMKRGVVLKSTTKKHFKVITEFIDPRRLNGTAYDADYWIDNDKIRNDDVLFFLTNSQKKILITDEYTTKDILKLFSDKKYELAILDDLSYTFSALRYLFVLYLKLSPSIFKLNNFFSCRVLSKAWSEYMLFLPLFLHYSSKSLIYVTIPNGHTGLRFDDAIVTALCRKHGIKSYGCQTRAIYSNNFEYCFNCFDVYLSWGTAWDRVSKARMLFVSESIVVGCIYLDYLLPTVTDYLNKDRENKPKESITVSVFPSDISSNHHYTKGYCKSFLIKCARLADKFPGCKFIVKSKEPRYTEIMKTEPDFYETYCTVKKNFAFLDQERTNYAKILSSSDIVVAIGFTTPGVEGLLVGRRSIYYSELICGGQAFRGIPNLVANDEYQLCRLLKRAVTNCRAGLKPDYNDLEELDPFRDGRALERIRRILT